MMEIGGYMGAEKYEGYEYHDGAIALNTGRNCLRYILRARKVKKILLPSYLCSVITDVCKEEQVEYEFYSIDAGLKPILSKEIEPEVFVYVINYFGQLSDEYLKELSQQYEHMIIDNAQSFFQLPVEGVDTIYTCRKFFGVPEGAYLYTDKFLDEDILYGSSVDKWKYIIGRYESSAAAYFSEFQKNEELLEKEKMKYMAPMTRNVLKGLDYHNIDCKRRRNAQILAGYLKKYNKLDVKVNGYGLYMYPLLVDNGEKIRETLIKEKIYISTLWPNVLCDSWSDNISVSLTRNLLPIPCDQRYSEEDMENVAKKVIDLMQNDDME